MTSSKPIWLLRVLLCLLALPSCAQKIPVHECDRLAVHPGDNNKVTPGVVWEQLDPKLALIACERAVRKYPEVNRFNYQYARALQKAGNSKKAETLVRSAAVKGYPQAQCALGNEHARGEGVPQDYAEAVRWFLKAADQESSCGQFMLGVMYAEGQGVPQNHAEAERWFSKAAGQGHADAQFNLGVGYYKGQGVPQDYREAVRWFRKAAELGHAQAQNNLGAMYAEGQGVPQNYAEAERWFSKAAEKGVADAQKHLGFLYYKVQQDYRRAVRWFRKAAELGHAQAQNNLGVMYAEGQGVPQDNVEAFKWYTLAAENGVATAKQNQRSISERMTTAQIAEARKLAREWQPKETK